MAVLSQLSRFLCRYEYLQCTLWPWTSCLIFVRTLSLCHVLLQLTQLLLQTTCTPIPQPRNCRVQHSLESRHKLRASSGVSHGHSFFLISKCLFHYGTGVPFSLINLLRYDLIQKILTEYFIIALFSQYLTMTIQMIFLCSSVYSTEML